jgi:ribosomal protein S18 acetylase RimI-like enzyme
LAPGQRRYGVGALLVAEVIEWARARSSVAVRLDVADENAAAIRFYERLGFAPSGRTSTPPRTHVTEHECMLVL